MTLDSHITLLKTLKPSGLRAFRDCAAAWLELAVLSGLYRDDIVIWGLYWDNIGAIYIYIYIQGIEVEMDTAPVDITSPS